MKFINIEISNYQEQPNGSCTFTAQDVADGGSAAHRYMVTVKSINGQVVVSGLQGNLKAFLGRGAETKTFDNARDLVNALSINDLSSSPHYIVKDTGYVYDSLLNMPINSSSPSTSTSSTSSSKPTRR